MASIKIPEQKIILCGEYGVGKSSIFRRFTNNTFVSSNDRRSTLGLDHFYKVYRVGDRDTKVFIFDKFYDMIIIIYLLSIILIHEQGKMRKLGIY